jgi:hypothetical protein
MATSWRQNLSRYQRYFLNIRALYDKRADLKMFLEILLSLSAISIFLLVALRPTLLTITNLLTEIKNKEETITELNTKIQNLSLAQTVYQNELTKIRLLDTAITNSASPESYIRQIEGIATRNNIALSGVSTGEIALIGKPKPAKEEKGARVMPSGTTNFSVSLSATGEYNNLIAFLRDVENLRRPLFIDSLGFTSFRVNEAQRLVLNLQGRVVFLPQTEVAK